MRRRPSTTMPELAVGWIIQRLLMKLVFVLSKTKNLVKVRSVGLSFVDMFGSWKLEVLAIEREY